MRMTLLGLALLVACAAPPVEPPPPDHDHTPTADHCGHIDASGFALESGGSVVARGTVDDEVGELSAIVETLGAEVQVQFERSDGTKFAVGDGCSQNSLEVDVADGAIVEVVRAPGVRWSFRLRGLAAGATTLVLRAYHEDHVHLATPPIVVNVQPAQVGGPRVTGRVRLASERTEITGVVTGTDVFDDATGVEVRLTDAQGVVTRALTEAGAFAFTGLEDGAYTVALGPPDVAPASASVVVTGADVDAGTLEFKPIGDMRTPPNPFAFAHGVGVEADLPRTEVMTIRIHSMESALVWSYEAEWPAGFLHIHWSGLNADEVAQPPGLYWALVRYAGEWHARVVHKLAQ